jgi:hypothetical protein
MRISVIVKTGAKKIHIEKTADRIYKVWVKSFPKNGKANKEVIEVLSNYFQYPKKKFAILTGLKVKNKTIEISE